MTFQENEKAKILVEQLKNANQRWKHLEESRMRLIEIFFGFIGATAFALIFANSKTSLIFMINPWVMVLIPLLFLSVGLGFFAFFWNKEMHFSIVRSWICRIEQEIQLIYKGQEERSKENYEGSYYLYYYEPSKKFDLVTKSESFILFLLTTIVVLLTVSILADDIYERLCNLFSVNSSQKYLSFFNNLLFY